MVIEEDDDYPALSIGVIAGGVRVNPAWDSAITELALRIEDVRKDRTSPLALVVVFAMPGEVWEPDFRGIRTSTFSRKHGILMLQIGLPPEPEGDAQAEVKSLLLAAVDAGENFARLEALIDLDDSLREVRSIVADVYRDIDG